MNSRTLKLKRTLSRPRLRFKHFRDCPSKVRQHLRSSLPMAVELIATAAGVIFCLLCVLVITRTVAPCAEQWIQVHSHQFSPLWMDPSGD